MQRPLFEVMSWSQSEIRLQMAFDRANNADFRAAWEAEQEAAQRENMTEQERAATLRDDLHRVFGGKKNDV